MTIPTYQIEVKKDAMRQNQDGVWKLTLTLHPQDVPTALFGDPMGQRYMLVLAPINDEEQPRQAAPGASGDAPPAERQEKDSDRLVKSAGALASDPLFARYANEKGADDPVKYIRAECGIKSRSELAWNTVAQQNYKRLYAQFRDWEKRAA